MTDLLRRRWPAVLVAAWAILLLVLAVSAYDGDATVREQRDVAAARGSVDRAAVEVIRAAGHDVAVRVSGYEFAGRCRVSLARSGAQYVRRIEFHPVPDREVRLLESISRRLPDRYAASLRGKVLSADADGFVTLRGRVAHGAVRVELHTGCRPSEAPVLILRTPPTGTERARIVEVLRLVGAKKEQPRWRTETVGCGEGAVRDVELTVVEAPARPLADAAGLVPPDARVLIREERRLAYRQGGVSVIAEVHGDALRVTRTVVGC